MARITLSEGQSKFLFWLIVALSMAVIVLASYNMYLKWKLKQVKVEIVEIKPVEIKVPEAFTPAVPEEVTPATPVVQTEEFDYEKLRREMATLVSETQKISAFVVSKEDALRLIRKSNLPYLITQVSEDTYSVVLLGDYTDTKEIAQRSLYGVYVITTVSEKLSKEISYDLRLSGFPSYVFEFTRDGKKYYSVVIGAFPTSKLANDYFKTLNWDEITKKARTSSPGFAGRLIVR